MKTADLLRALHIFATLDPTHLPIHFSQVLLVVAESEPCTFRCIAQRLDLSNSAVSRTIHALGLVNRKGQEGFDLVQVVRDPAEGRRFLVQLTPKGRAVVRALEAI
jgi:DNA-binding MarR family transcriptional regulator